MHCRPPNFSRTRNALHTVTRLLNCVSLTVDKLPVGLAEFIFLSFILLFYLLLYLLLPLMNKDEYIKFDVGDRQHYQFSVRRQDLTRYEGISSVLRHTIRRQDD